MNFALEKKQFRHTCRHRYLFRFTNFGIYGLLNINKQTGMENRINYVYNFHVMLRFFALHR